MGNLETGSYISAVPMQFSRAAPLGVYMQRAYYGGQDQHQGREVAQRLFHLGHGGA